MSQSQDYEPSPEEDADVERLLKITELRHRVQLTVPPEHLPSNTESLTLKQQERFWKHILALHAEEEEIPLGEMIYRKSGLLFPALEKILDEQQLTSKLWDLIHALAQVRYFLQNTDHLSDSQCYHLLRDQILTSTGFDQAADCEWNTTLSLDDYGIPEEMDSETVTLTYYATDEERAEWQAYHPDKELPPKKKTPFSRDAQLPVPSDDVPEA